MVPLQLIFLMLLVLVPLQLAPPGPASTQPAVTLLPTSLFPPSPPLVTLTFIFSTHLALLLFTHLRARAAIRHLHNSAISSVFVAATFDRSVSMIRWGTVLLAFLQVWVMGWSRTVDSALAHTTYIKYIPLLAPAIFATPALLTWIFIWLAQHRVETAIRQRSVPYLLAQGLPTHDMPSASTYLWMQIRHNLYLLVPIGLASAIEQIVPFFDRYWKYASYVSSPLIAVTLLVLAPWLITRIWDTTPLRGPLRDRLERLAAEHRIRFRQIYVWKTNSLVTNAAILGYLPFARYFLMTDALLESLTDRQIEAVFAHEVGHAVHKHLWWYGLTLISAFLLAAVLGDYAASLLVQLLTSHTSYTLSLDSASLFFTFALLGLFLLLGFSFVSRRFEHQADLFAAKHMANSLEREPLLNLPPPLFPETPTPLEHMTLDQYIRGDNPATTPQSQTPANSLLRGTEIFNSALEALVDVSHRSRERASWLHPSINNRLSLLRQIATDPATAQQFAQRMFTTRLLLILLLLTALASAFLPTIQK